MFTFGRITVKAFRVGMFVVFSPVIIPMLTGTLIWDRAKPGLKNYANGVKSEW